MERIAGLSGVVSDWATDLLLLGQLIGRFLDALQSGKSLLVERRDALLKQADGIVLLLMLLLLHLTGRSSSYQMVYPRVWFPQYIKFAFALKATSARFVLSPLAGATPLKDKTSINAPKCIL